MVDARGREDAIEKLPVERRLGQGLRQAEQEMVSPPSPNPHRKCVCLEGWGGFWKKGAPGGGLGGGVGFCAGTGQLGAVRAEERGVFGEQI